jgi:hypothetical protein
MSRQFVTRQRLQPHPKSAALLRDQADIYRSGRTPVVDETGALHAWDIQPANASQTGRQLEEIRGSFGSEGLSQTIAGLRLTRGPEFAATALRSASPEVARSVSGARDGADPGDLESEEPADGGDVAQAIRGSRTSSPLPEQLRERLSRTARHSFAEVRVHDNSAAHKAAELLNARAFTIGHDVYLARGEYQPASGSGQSLLAHEAAHTVQQQGAAVPALEKLSVTSPGDPEEIEAERFAETVVGSRSIAAPLTLTPSVKPARIQRAISFTRSNDAFVTNTMTVNPTAAGFQARPSATPLFQWSADVTIHGTAGDPFGNFEVGPLQVVREKWMNIYWGTGADRTHRNVKNSAKPARDEAPGSGSPWYSNWRASPAFGASGDVRSTTLADSPQRGVEPWTNPVAGRGGTRGWFNYGMAFVGYISARDTTVGTGAAAYHPTGNVYWNFGIDGHWNNADPVATRMVTSGGTVNHSRAFDGGSGEFPSMHGGTSSHNLEVTTTT